MASLIEDLISTLENQRAYYEELLILANNKTDIIIKGDVSSLQDLTRVEQELAGRVLRLDKKREELIKDIALVTNKDAATLTISEIIQMLENQTNEHDQLQKVSLEIKSILDKMVVINNQNKKLLQQSLDYIDFTMNALQSSKSAPTNVSYQSKGNAYGAEQGQRFFDTKQ